MTQTGGEKELIIGNKQLISLFFVVVALCGVFFAMGYMVRGNSLKGSVSTTTTATDSSAAAPSETTVRRQQPEPPAETTDSAALSNRPAGDSESSVPPIDTKPAQETPAPAQTETPAPAAVSAAESGPAYVVQVGALAHADAETTARTLREQHLPAFTAASSKENLYRVLVGPYHLTSDVADAKAKLKTLGFSNTIVQKQ
jgi:cell division septation protein DedD